MIRKLVIHIALILCGLPAFSQKIHKVTFEHLVDYANCQYLLTFIENSNIGETKKDAFENSIKLVLQKAALEDLENVPDYNRIANLINDKSYENANQLAKKINTRKNNYDKFFDNYSLINSLRTPGWKNVDLQGVAKKTIDSINAHSDTIGKQDAKIKQDNSYGSQNKNATNDSLRTNELKMIDELQKQNKNLQSKVFTLQLLVASCLIILSVLIVTSIRWYKSQLNASNRYSSVRRFVKDVVLNSKEINDKFQYTRDTTKVNDINNTDALESKINRLEQQIEKLHSTIISIRTDENQVTLNQIPSQTALQFLSPSLTKEPELYFASKNDKKLTEQLPNYMNASFKVFEIDDNEAKFEYIGTVKNENWFDGICIIENSPNDDLSDKKGVITTQVGKLKKENDNWIAVKLPRIKFV